MAQPSDASTKLPLLGVVALALGGAAYLATVNSGEGPKSPTKKPAPAAPAAPDAGPSTPTPPPEAGALRARLDRYYRTRNLRPPPERCAAEGVTALAWLAETAELLQEGRAGADRPEDRAALARYETPEPQAEVYAEYEFLRAQALLHTKAEPEDVERAYELAQQHCDDWVEPFLVHGRWLLERGRAGPALGRFRAVRSQADDIPKIRFAIAQAYHAGGDVTRTLVTLDELLGQTPDDLQARRLRGFVRLSAEDPKGAAEDLRVYLERRAQDGLAHLRLGQALTAVKDRAAAKAAFCRAKALGVTEAAEGCPDG